MNQAVFREDVTGALQAMSYMKRYDTGERTKLLLEQLEAIV